LPERLADALLRRAGIEADAGLRARAEDFLRARRIDAALLARLPDARLAAWGRLLAAGLPTDYRDVMAATPLSRFAAEELSGLRCLAAVLPAGAAMPSLVADFERGVWYRDECWPVFEDAGRAEDSGALDGALRGDLLRILEGADLPRGSRDWRGELPPGGGQPACLALRLPGGVVRWTALGADSGAPESLYETLEALLARAGGAGEMR